MRGRCGLVLVVLSLAAAPAHAQPELTFVPDDFGSIVDVSAGLSIQGPADVNERPTCKLLALPCASGRTFPDFGLALSGAYYPTEALGLVAELSAYADQWYGYGSPCPVGTPIHHTCPTSYTDDVRAALAGIRVRTPVLRYRWWRTRLFAQALAGGQWTDVGPMSRARQLGVGIDDVRSNGIAVRMAYDYRVAADERRNFSTGRFFIGVNLPIVPR